MQATPVLFIIIVDHHLYTWELYGIACSRSSFFFLLEIDSFITDSDWNRVGQHSTDMLSSAFI